MKDAAKLIQESSNQVASQAKGMLKSEINHVLKEEVEKMDDGLFTKVQ